MFKINKRILVYRENWKIHVDICICIVLFFSRDQKRVKNKNNLCLYVNMTKQTANLDQ